MVTDGEDGLIFENRNSDALADCLARLMDHPEELAEMGRKAKDTYESRFTGKIFAENVEHVYQHVLEK